MHDTFFVWPNKATCKKQEIQKKVIGKKGTDQAFLCIPGIDNMQECHLQVKA